MQAQETRTVNGLDVTGMFETLDAVKRDPSLALFRFRAKNQWITGGENRSTIRDFFGAGREDDSRKATFEFVNGEPPVLLGNNEGANPVEFLLHALAGCVTTTTVLHAAARGITVHEISTTLEGDIDLHGLFGMADEGVGYREIRMSMRIKADCDDDALADLIRFARDHSPVCNTICRPVPVRCEWTRA